MHVQVEEAKRNHVIHSTVQLMVHIQNGLLSASVHILVMEECKHENGYVHHRSMEVKVAQYLEVQWIPVNVTHSCVQLSSTIPPMLVKVRMVH